MRGRKAVPAQMKLVKGNPGRRPINNEPPFDAVEEAKVPDAPDWLHPEQQEFWGQLAPLFAKANVLRETDLHMLSAMCIVLGEMKFANEQLKVSRLVRTPNGHVQTSPFVSMLNQAIKRFQSLASEFGMTPAARTRILVRAGVKPEDELADYLGRGRQKA